MNSKTIEYHRKPTQSEIKFGEGARHYLSVDDIDARKSNGELKKWLKNPYDKTDQSRYYY